MIKAEIITDSVGPNGVRLTTFRLTYPRFIHSELMTHRVFSRNAASSRAIPFQKMIEAIESNPAKPEVWGSAKPGMQSGAELGLGDRGRAVDIWISAMHDAIDRASALDRLGVHKSISNRLLEPFAHMVTIVTATEWENFFALRAHPDAQPEFRILATEMLNLYTHASPHLRYGWHLPFITDRERHEHDLSDLLKMSVARCARVSYLNFKDSTLVEDTALHDRLVENGHWSPFEHQARAQDDLEWSGNFRGWKQYRKTFDGENRTANLNAIWER